MTSIIKSSSQIDASKSEI